MMFLFFACASSSLVLLLAGTRTEVFVGMAELWTVVDPFSRVFVSITKMVVGTSMEDWGADVVAGGDVLRVEVVVGVGAVVGLVGAVGETPPGVVVGEEVGGLTGVEEGVGLAVGGVVVGVVLEEGGAVGVVFGWEAEGDAPVGVVPADEALSCLLTRATSAAAASMTTAWAVAERERATMRTRTRRVETILSEFAVRARCVYDLGGTEDGSERVDKWD